MAHVVGRLGGEADFREAWAAIVGAPPPGFDEEMEIQQYLQVRRPVGRMLGGTEGLAQHPEEARPEGGMPERN